MMYHWFSTYTGDSWTPEKGYNSTFRDQIILLRNWFGLEKAGPGLEEGTNRWREYQLQEKTVYVKADALSWREYRAYAYHTTPLLQLNIVIAKGNKKKVIFEDTIVIEFPDRYPSAPPFFRVNKYRNERASHDHHLNGGGVLCILASEYDWDPNRDTIISGLNAAFDWLVWHHTVFNY